MKNIKTILFLISIGLLTILSLSFNTKNTAHGSYNFEEEMPDFSGGVAHSANQNRTGSPTSLGTCASCHSGGSGTTTVGVVLKNSTGTAVTQYSAGLTYTVEVTITGTSGTRRALQSTITTAANAQAGTLSSPSAGARVATTGGLQFLEHSTPAVSSTSSTFTASWVAPAAGTGTVTVYGVGMSANGNGGTSGDNVSSPVAVSFTEAVSDVFTIDTVVACDTYTWIDGNTYTASTNLPKDTVNLAGYDSIITLDLTINSSSTGTDVRTECDSYTWIDGVTYTTSNTTAKDTIPNVAGCDSIITLNLTITNSTSSRDVQSACNSFTWIDGNTYTSNTNSVTDTLINSAGCDSVVTLDLRITTIDTTLSFSGTTITSNESSPGTLYQWIDCGTNTPIMGATSASFAPTSAGSYAAILTVGACSDTSECFNYNPTAIKQLNKELISVYPNPFNDFIVISGVNMTQANLTIYDLAGKEYSNSITIKENRISTSNLPKGMYILNVNGKTTKLVKL